MTKDKVFFSGVDLHVAAFYLTIIGGGGDVREEVDRLTARKA